MIHSGGGSTSDLSLSSSSLSSLNSTTQQLSDSASPPLAITLKNSINLVAIKTSKANNGLSSNVASTSKGHKDSGKGGENNNKIPKLAPMKGYDGLGILTPATSPKNQQQQQLIADNHLLNGSSGGNVMNSNVDNLQNIPLTPVSPAASPSSSITSNVSFQQHLKKTDS